MCCPVVDVEGGEEYIKSSVTDIHSSRGVAILTQVEHDGLPAWFEWYFGITSKEEVGSVIGCELEGNVRV